MVDNDVNEILVACETPAFVRRARQVAGAWNYFLEGCRRERAQRLEMPAMRLARVFALLQSANHPAASLVDAADLRYLDGLRQEWQPRLKSKVGPAKTEADVVRALSELGRSFERFNDRWLRYLSELNLEPLNQLRDNYNRYYLLEKECALRSIRNVQKGYVPLQRVTLEQLLELFPLLKCPTPAHNPTLRGR